MLLARRRFPARRTRREIRLGIRTLAYLSNPALGAHADLPVRLLRALSEIILELAVGPLGMDPNRSATAEDTLRELAPGVEEQDRHRESKTRTPE